ncbi:MAG TPA: DUF2207 domain-containing protein [Terriglobia bacterium]|nr:DUF2207 domain-containing protein [Terriglobia bacterium]
MLKRLSLLTVTLFAIFTWSFATVLNAQETVPAPSTEQILSYNSDVTVNPDSTVLVQETIKVLTTAAQIQHGIYRDFLTRYHDQFGNPYTIHLEVASLERDGQPEEFHLRKLASGLRISMGESSELVPPGQHTYELTYTLDRAIGFFSDHDELYWNVTGHGWILPIQQATATLHLPKGITQEAILLDAYTGRQDSVGTDYAASVDSQSNATFRTKRALGPYEGLAIVARWPKGFVSPPTDDQKYRYFLEDNQASLIGLAGLVVVLIYYTTAWFLTGRDPARGAIAPRSEPPRGFSPAAVRYVWRMAFDQKTMVANLVDLAVKKQLAILEDVSGGYILGRLKSNPPRPGTPLEARVGKAPKITPDEKLLLDKLFAAGDTIRLGPAHHTLVGGAVEALHYHLRSNLERYYFRINGRYLIPGLVISLATVVRCGFSIQGGQRLLVFFLATWLLLWSLACLTLGTLARAAWRNALSDPQHAPTARKQAMILSMICLLFFIGEVAGLGVLAWAASTGVAVVLVLLVVINYLFHCLLKASTRSGRALLGQIEGFRMFLTTTEWGHRDARIARKFTLDLFERFLPYAMALNVEKVWSEKFAASQAQTAPEGTADYSPVWYTGPGWNRLTAATFATSLGNSFSSALSSSMKAPGSGSGSRGSSGGRGGRGGRGR